MRRGMEMGAVIVAATLVACAANPPQAVVTPEPAVTATAQTLVATDDHRSAQITLRYARTFSVEYHDHYKLVTVLKPWRDAQVTFRYVLVQRGTQARADVGDAQVIEVPVNRVIAVNTTHLPYLDRLGLTDKLVGVGEANRINTPSVVEAIKAGKLPEVGRNAEVNVERAIELQPDMVTVLGLGNPEKDNYPALMKAGLKVVLIADFMEATPLGRAEWIKFMALFFNREAMAEKLFDEVALRYEKMAAIARNVPQKPAVFMGFDNDGKWYMPGGQSYQARYLADAGANYLWADDQSSGRIPLSLEAVFDRAADADVWVNQSQSWTKLEQVLGADERYAKFAAVKQGNMYNNNARLNPTGGNDYNESGHANPDVVLADLIKIFHPELLPNHELVYYHRLK
ncbi:MAG: ABC transporter substrate-binding protein [Chloroflexi bacterium]|nr:ABC transporter substrate-binding protein [Chloroflexota bacterium]